LSAGCGAKYCGRCGRPMPAKLRERYLRWRRRRSAMEFAKAVDAMILAEYKAKFKAGDFSA